MSSDLASVTLQVINIDGAEYDLESLTYSELKDLKLNVCERLARINSQIQGAKASVHADGGYADPEWFAKANGARRYYGWIDQRLAAELAHQKDNEKQLRIERAKREREQFLIVLKRVLRRRLDTGLYKSLITEAVEEYDAQ